MILKHAMRLVIIATVAAMLCGVIRAASHADQNYSDKIAQIETLPRIDRIREYEQILRRQEISAAELPVLRALARHIGLLCSHYGMRDFPFNENKWAAILKRGFVHFCVLTSNPAAHRAATLEQCRKEIEILNSSFRSLAGEPLVRFEFKSLTTYEEINGVASEIFDFADGRKPYDTWAFEKAFNACADPRIRDSHAINFLIYDSHSAAAGD